MTFTPERPPVAPPSLQEIAEGIFAYVQPNGGWCLNNAGLVVDAGTSVLVDTVATQARAIRLREAIVRVAGAGPDILVSTHHHGDHVFGNAQFAPGATIVAHEQTRVEMSRAGLGLRELWPDVEWGDTPLLLPSLTFRDAITIHAGALRLDIVHVGPAHTTGDVVVWVPDRKVLFAGDIVMSGATPFCLMGSIQGSLRAVERLREFGADTVVAGHGPVGGAALFDVTERYLHWVWELAVAGIAAGMPALDVAREADLGEFTELLDTERLVGNLHRAYVELTESRPLGTTIDVLGSFREMIEFHGGLPDCHA